MGWEGLPDVVDVEPLGPGDEAVFAELREVLVRHDALDRIGLALLHSHFDIEPEEVLIESVDLESRTLIAQPMPVEELSGTLTPTVVQLTPQAENVIVSRYCHRPPNSDFHAMASGGPDD